MTSRCPGRPGRRHQLAALRGRLGDDDRISSGENSERSGSSPGESTPPVVQISTTSVPARRRWRTTRRTPSAPSARRTPSEHRARVAARRALPAHDDGPESGGSPPEGATDEDNVGDVPVALADPDDRSVDEAELGDPGAQAVQVLDIVHSIEPRGRGLVASLVVTRPPSEIVSSIFRRPGDVSDPGSRPLEVEELRQLLEATATSLS